MEIKLNKIDPDLRQRINDKTKEGKIHRKEDISINSENYNKNSDSEGKKKKKKDKFSLAKYANKKINVNAVKVVQYEIVAEKDEELGNASDNKGLFIDSRG